MITTGEIIGISAYVVATFTWEQYFIWWIFNTYHINSPTKLHSIITIYLILKFFYDLVYSCSLAGWGSDIKYFEVPLMVLYVLYNIFAYACVFLISKGYCITRMTIPRSDWVLLIPISLCIVLGFISYLAYLIVLAFVFALIFKSINMMISIYARTYLERKYKLLVLILILYFISQVLVLCLTENGVYFEMSFIYFICVRIVNEISEMSAFMMIFGLFRIIRRRRNIEMGRIPPIVSARVPIGFSVDFNQLDNEIPVVIQAPDSILLGSLIKNSNSSS